jgi:hypothetical protein
VGLHGFIPFLIRLIWLLFGWVETVNDFAKMSFVVVSTAFAIALLVLSSAFAFFIVSRAGSSNMTVNLAVIAGKVLLSQSVAEVLCFHQSCR